MRFDRLGDITTRVGESPVWDDRRGCVFLVDIEGRAIHAPRLDGTTLGRWDMPDRPGSLGLTTSGRLLVALGCDLVLFDPESGALAPFAEVEPRPGLRLNDGKVGADGAFWVGSMALATDRPPVGRLYRIGADGAVTIAREGLRTPNGLAWTLDGTGMFHSDSRTATIWRADTTPRGALGESRVFATAGDGEGRPDGAAMDAEGGYWSAAVFGGHLRRHASDGSFARVDVPHSCPTMPCFAGPDLRAMVVTCLDPDGADDAPVLIADAGTTGAPVPRFSA